MCASPLAALQQNNAAEDVRLSKTGPDVGCQRMHAGLPVVMVRGRRQREADVGGRRATRARAGGGS